MQNVIILWHGRGNLTKDFKAGDTITNEIRCPKEIRRWIIDNSEIYAGDLFKSPEVAEALAELEKYESHYTPSFDSWGIWADEWAVTFHHVYGQGQLTNPFRSVVALGENSVEGSLIQRDSYLNEDEIARQIEEDRRELYEDSPKGFEDGDEDSNLNFSEFPVGAIKMDTNWRIPYKFINESGEQPARGFDHTEDSLSQWSLKEVLCLKSWEYEQLHGIYNEFMDKKRNDVYLFPDGKLYAVHSSTATGMPLVWHRVTWGYNRNWPMCYGW